MADEISLTGTPHTHLFIFSESPIRFTTLKNRFPIAHIEKSYRTCKENKDYILKQGKWENTEKAETKVEGTFEEYGDCPKEKEEKDPEKTRLIEMIYEGKTNIEILEECPNYAFKLKDIDYLRNSLLENKYNKEFRKINVSYYYGYVSNSIKIKYIFKKHSDSKICLISNFDKNLQFDNYKGEDVLIIEFDSNKISLNTILNLMKGVPVQLPARFINKQSSFTYLYLVCIEEIEQHYVNEQGRQRELFKEFKEGFEEIFKFKNNQIIDQITGEVKELSSG